MSSVKLVLRTQQQDKQGHCPLYIRVIKNRKTKFISTGFKISVNQWDEEKQRVKKNYPNSARVNANLAQKIADAEGQVADMERKSKNVSARKLKEAIKGKVPTNFFFYAERWLEINERRISRSTKRAYEGCLRKIEEFHGDRDLEFEDINLMFLQNFMHHMMTVDGNTATTVRFKFAVMKVFYKEAIKEDLVNANLYPFNKITVKKDASKRTYLTKEQVEKVKNVVLNSDSKAPVVRDMFIFCVYAGGLRFSDVVELTWDNVDIEQQKIKKVIRKTGRLHSFKFGETAKEVLQKYAAMKPEKKGFIFPLLYDESPFFTNDDFRYSEISRVHSNCTLHLSKIGKQLDFPFNLSFHLARHTFATNALNNGMRIEHVSKLMDHSDISITQVYAKIISKELDDAVDKYIY